LSTCESSLGSYYWHHQALVTTTYWHHDSSVGLGGQFVQSPSDELSEWSVFVTVLDRVGVQPLQHYLLISPSTVTRRAALIDFARRIRQGGATDDNLMSLDHLIDKSARPAGGRLINSTVRIYGQGHVDRSRDEKQTDHHQATSGSVPVSRCEI